MSELLINCTIVHCKDQGHTLSPLNFIENYLVIEVHGIIEEVALILRLFLFFSPM